jgi:hypothetical protein
MHIMPVYYTTTGRQRAKFKYASAEHKRQAEQLAEDWATLKKSHGESPVSTKKSIPNARTLGKSLPKIPQRGTLLSQPSVNTGVGVATKADVPVYTGTKMIGVSQMAKSNAVPVFDSEHIIDIARMRR